MTEIKESIKKTLEKIPDGIMYWLKNPAPSKNHYDDIWHEEELFKGEWVLIQNKVEWYESPNVVTIYTDHKYIFNQNMEIDKPDETFYYENVDSGEFESVIEVSQGLPSTKGQMKLTTNISTKSAPEGENNFAMVEYDVDVHVKYDLPNGMTSIPRIIARPLNKLFKRYFEKIILEEIVEGDIEFARETLAEYFEYIRKYHGEEPIQTKTKQETYTPAPEERRFFQ